MNNKGFAITTILYGTLILFLMLLLSLLGILSSYKDRLGILIDNSHAARDIIMSAKFERPEPEPEEVYECYYYNGSHVHLVSSSEELGCENNCVPTLVDGEYVYPDVCENDFLGGRDFESCSFSGDQSYVSLSGIVCTKEE